MHKLSFNPSSGPTIGVELELQILSASKFKLSSSAPNILSSIDHSFEGRIKPEFIQSMVEINTGICKDVSEVEEDLRESYRHLEEVAERYGCFVYAASLHPFSQGKEQKLTDHPRYRRIMGELQLVGKRFITQGLHVHIGIKSAQQAIDVTNIIRAFLPMLLALTTSSPYYEGVDTGLLSYRTKLFEALPLAGIPDSIDNWSTYVRLVDILIHGGIIESFKDLWWDVRPHPDFGTVEVRVCDIPSSMRDILTITATIQALIVAISERREYHLPHIQVLRANKWQAARHGLDGVFVDSEKHKSIPMSEAIEELYEFLRPIAKELGSIKYLEGIKDILKRKTSAHLQKKIYSNGGSFEKVIDKIRRGFWL
ncbi:MAG: YbdK family carboxylate-amine ligase [Nitrospirae bacterium]|nr:MAG: YbdK family carboxylate-amine ligase [Nitrospirota bacterium]